MWLLDVVSISIPADTDHQSFDDSNENAGTGHSSCQTRRCVVAASSSLPSSIQFASAQATLRGSLMTNTKLPPDPVAALFQLLFLDHDNELLRYDTDDSFISFLPQHSCLSNTRVLIYKIITSNPVSLAIVQRSQTRLQIIVILLQLAIPGY